MDRYREDMAEAFGLKKGQKVRVLEETMGDDHEGIEHTMPAGSIGWIDHIEFIPKQGTAFHVVIPVDETNERCIVNVFDESDGPITNFLEAL
ncbi:MULTISPECIES: hypothetical protein [unclassified Bradyrhizobium]|uniref:hypothetical protein n=1 Tax=unclassified Bradyrhizobium TaxID=2631580 RepID=UPI00291668C8|nr:MULTISPECIES: hypothetical protein [unclassified Bradyrhizobium]